VYKAVKQNTVPFILKSSYNHSKAFSPPFRKFALLGLVRQHLQPCTHKQNRSVKASSKINAPLSPPAHYLYKQEIIPSPQYS